MQHMFLVLFRVELENEKLSLLEKKSIKNKKTDMHPYSDWQQQYILEAVIMSVLEIYDVEIWWRYSLDMKQS